jgi:hypothetical protein
MLLFYPKPLKIQKGDKILCHMSEEDCMIYQNQIPILSLWFELLVFIEI